MPADSPPESSEPPSHPQPYRAAWPWVLCVVGLDYLSTLGYMPSIAFDSAGRLAPLVMGVLALVTVLGALPVYWYIAGRSPNGQGVLALLERHIPGWTGKLLILVLLGFAATDFIFTRTFSTADAAEHLLHGPHPAWQQALGQTADWYERNKDVLPDGLSRALAGWSNRQLSATLLLLLAGMVVGIIFRRGIRGRFVQLAAVTVLLYAALNLLVIGSGVLFLADHPERVQQWWEAVRAGDWDARSAHAAGPVNAAALGATCVQLFPKVILGLSGFEIIMLLMPLVKGRPNDDPAHPRGRIRNARKVLLAAALTMPLYLIAASFVTTLLIPPEAFRTSGQAANRALAYLAHGGPVVGLAPGETVSPLFGLSFGTLYDASTVAILCLAGVSISLCLADYVPPYLHRLGMELDWVHRLGALIYLFTAIKVLVTFYYRASVDEQRGAYATSVLVVFTAAAFAAALDVWKRRSHRLWLLRLPVLFGPILALFAFGLAEVVLSEPGGAKIALWFIGFTLVTSIVTRFYRTTELRCPGFDFADERSREDFEKLKTLDFPILVPHRPGRHTLAQKEIEIRSRHRLPGELPVVFVVAGLGDPSEFQHRPVIRVTHEEGRVVIHVTRCASVAHVIAAIGIEMSRVGVAPEIHFGWSNENPLTANLHFVLFGHGNVPWLVYALLRNSDLPESQRPRVVVG
jgi:hypothetical protein